MNEPTPILQRLLSVKEVAEQTGLPQSTIYNAANAGTLRCVRFGKRIRFRPEAVAQWIAASESHSLASYSILEQ
jgi:excisionase family DNA binding protein